MMNDRELVALWNGAYGSEGLMAQVQTQVHKLNVGDSFVSAKSGVTLKVAERRSDWTVLASQDGKTFQRGVWHTDADGEEGASVWVEVWDGFDQCQFHGTVDAVSRKVCQVG